MSRSPLEFLRHILDETRYIGSKTSRLSKESFLQDETLKRAFVRSLEIIGAAVKQVPEDFRQKYSHIEWRAIAGMRDRLIHRYFGVDYDIVWDAAINNIPALQNEIEEILRKECGH